MRKNHVGFLSSCFLLALFCNVVLAEDWQLEMLPKAKLQQPIPFSQVHLYGELGARYMAATCNILTRTDRYPLDSFAASAAGRPGALWWDWPGDQIGRWLSVVHVAEGYGWTPAASMPLPTFAADRNTASAVISKVC